MRIDSIDILKSFTKYKNGESIIIPYDNNPKKLLTFIYGPNGTGKSSLSKLFYLANLKLENDFEYREKLKKLKAVSESDDMYVSICYSDESKTIFNGEEIENPIKIPTFNRDYVDSKITFQNDFKNNRFNEQNLIYSIELESKTNYQNKNREYEDIKEKGVKLVNEINEKIEIGISQIVSEIGVKKNNSAFTEYNIENFVKLNENEIPSDLKAKRKEQITLIQNLKNIDENDKIYFNIPWLENIMDLKTRFNNINNILAFNEDKEKLAFVKNYLDKFSNEEIDWKLKGIDYIKDNKCPFCNNDITNNDIINIYKNYINSTVKETEDFIKQQINEITNQKRILENNDLILTKSKKSDELFNLSISEKLEELFLKLNNTYDKAIKILEQKLTDKNLYIDCTELIEKIDIDYLNDINELYNKIKSLISSVNSKIDYSGKERTNKNSLYLSNTGKYIVFDNIKQEIKELKILREKAKILMNDLKIAEKAYKQELQEKNELIKTMNNILDDFTITNYRVNKTFDLCLNNVSVSCNANEYLSDGEKNIIALTLFIAELKLLYTQEEKNIIFIDDPVTSIDYPNLYGIYVYLKEIIEENSNSQIIITSHNTTFLNLFKFHFRESNYIKLKTDENDKTICEQDDKIFDTAYMERLKEIYKVYKDNNINSKQKLFIHNYCRYVIETISRFEYPDHNNDSDSSKHFIKKLKEKIIEDKSKFSISLPKLNCLEMIINKGSHATIENVLDDETFEDTDYINCCEVIIKYIYVNYEGQYNLLSMDYTNTSKLNNKKNKNKEQI